MIAIAIGLLVIGLIFTIVTLISDEQDWRCSGLIGWIAGGFFVLGLVTLLLAK